MKRDHSNRRSGITTAGLITGAALFLIAIALVIVTIRGTASTSTAGAGRPQTNGAAIPTGIDFERRFPIDTSGYTVIGGAVTWQPNATLSEISDAWKVATPRLLQSIDDMSNRIGRTSEEEFMLLHSKASILNFEGDPKKAYQALVQARALCQSGDLAQRGLFGTIFFQGVTGLRRGENENCIMCRGESSCIIPISAAARHVQPEGSRLAIQHFTEYLDQFPDDLEVQWLLNIAHMTLGEHPAQVDPRYLVSLEHFQKNEFDIGRFRDIGHLVGVNQLTQGGGAIMDDFDNDGLLDIAITTFDPTTHMQVLRNTGMGTFEDRSTEAGVTGQLGGLNCMQTDYNNDGLLDIYIVRGAWLPNPMRPTLLRNEGNCTFQDVTEEAGLLDSANSISASWADYDNDGWLDLFLCCERQPSRLYHNLKDGTFQEVSREAGLVLPPECKGAAWIDHDNDGYPDLFLDFMADAHGSQFFQNNRDGTFTNASRSKGIDGPIMGFSCWAWDYDNDGWLDIFATCYDRGLGDIVKGIQGVPHSRNSNRLFHNEQGRGFKDVTKEAGLDLVFATMGSNFGDFDNDGFLDMYLGTGEPDLATLVPNRMFKNVAGKRFSEITALSGTGNLQKGHGVACGDWDRDGNTDIFIEMGGAVKGDAYHNILFQNPGHDHNWLSVKLIGDKTNRAAIGARIKVVTTGENPLTVHRHVTSGSSFGANPLEQHIGLGKASGVATVEIYWPTSDTTQIFHDIAVNQGLVIKEFADNFEKRTWKPIALRE